MPVLTALTFWALATTAAPAPAEPQRVGAQTSALVRIVRAAAVRNGHTDERHQRRRGTTADGQPLTFIEFE